MVIESTMMPLQRVGMCIHEMRGQRVIVDADLAKIYGVTTKRLNEAVKRNRDRFPSDFAFQFTRQEAVGMRSQIATASKRNVRFLPYAFTEHGAIMAATVLNSERAVEMSVFVVRAFVRLREMLSTNQQLSGKIDELERRLDTHDASIQELIEAIRELMEPPPASGRPIGFQLPAAKKES